MKKINILCLATLLFAAGCGKESPFDPEKNDGEGQILKSAIAVDMKVDETIRKKVNTRADVTTDDFTVIFTKEGELAPTKKFKYSEMPDIVSLPAGDYICAATYGENRLAEWDSPYFVGVSDSFTVNPYEITSYVAPIECRLENIKVTIDFDSNLKATMSEDSYVEVKVGSSSSLKYGIAEAETSKAGYFMHTAETTLVATFIGKVDGVDVSETKSLNNVNKGNHYKITFKKHAGSDPTGGTGTLGVEVDATVKVVNVERNIQIEDEKLLDDSERPREDPVNPNPVNPNPELPTAKAPEIVGLGAVKLDEVNDGNQLTECQIKIYSYAENGIEELYCDIESPTLTPDELALVGLASHLDLAVTPEDLQTPLGRLGFPINQKGQKEVDFNITDFLPLLQALGEGEHHFVITIKDANGSSTRHLIIKY